MRKLVKLGTTTRARMSPFHFSETLNAARYATGSQINKHAMVAIVEILRVDLNTLKKVSSKTFA